MRNLAVLSFLTVFIILILCGCGGEGGNGVTNINTAPATKDTGSVEIKIDWDEIDALVSSLNNNSMTGQIIPSTTHHIKFTLYAPAAPSLVGDPNTPVNYPATILPSYPDSNGISTINPVTVARPDNSITINNIPCGRLMMRFEAQDSNNKNLATRIRFITILHGQTVPVTANLGITIENRSFNPDEIVVSPGDTLTWGNYTFLYDYYITFTMNGVPVSLYVPPMHSGAPAMGKFVSYVIPSTTATEVPVYLRTGSPSGTVVDTGLILVNSSGEPGHSFDTATSVALPYNANHSISAFGTDNFYKITLSSYKSFHIDINFNNVNGDLDLYLYDSSQSEIGYSMGTTNQEVIEKSLNAGIYYVKVHGYNGATNSYSINMTEL